MGLTEEGTIGRGWGSITGETWRPLLKHCGHKMGCLRVDSPPWGWGLVCLHLVLTDSKSQGPPSKTGAPTLEVPPPGLWSCLSVCGTWCTGTLDELVGSHTKLAIYPALTICCQRVVIHASLYTRFKGMQVVTYPANIKQLKSYWLKVPPKGLGTCIWINETHGSFWLCSAPQEAPR